MSGIEKKTVIFICTHNSARSQMAEGILREFCGEKFDVFSAGTAPSRVNPYAIRVMEEIGIDISEHSSKNLEKFEGSSFDYIITVCDDAREACPVFRGGDKQLHRGFRDPSKFRGKDDEILAGFREVRDEIKEWIQTEFDCN